MMKRIKPFLLLSLFAFGFKMNEIRVPASKVIVLPDSCIIEDSFEISCVDGQRIKRGEYILDKVFGKVSFVEGVQCESLIVKYAFVRLSRLSYDGGLEIKDVQIEPIHRRVLKNENNVELSYSGSLLRSLTLSSYEGVRTESGLNLELDAKLGEKSGIKTVIADEDIPIQPEGTTEELEELNKIFISAYSEHFAISFGSFDYSSRGAYFLNYRRKLEGLAGNVNYDRFSFKGTFGGINRKYNLNFFYGIDGVLGPYELWDINGKHGIVVVAGSEKVYLNGVLLRRGENNDYTIDYSQGTITFTPKHIITKDSRITVEFEYSDEAYFKRFMASSIRVPFSDAFEVGFEFLEEKDDPEKLTQGELSYEEKFALKNAGNDPSLARVPAFFPSSKGDYNMIIDSTGDSIFVYAGQDSGTYEVTFYDVGEGKGEYKFDPRGFFVYVGKFEGRYSPYKHLPMPALNQYMGFLCTFTPLSFLKLEFETVSGRSDFNTLSDIGDEKNSSIAYVSRGELKGVSGFRSSFFYEKREPYFRPPARIGEVEFQRIWATSDTGGLSRGEMSIGYSYGKYLDAEISAGRLSKSKEKSSRYSTKLTLEFPHFSASGNLEFTKLKSYSSLQWLKGSYILVATERIVDLSFAHSLEAKDESSSDTRISEFTPALKLNISKNSGIKLYYTYRKEKQLKKPSHSFEPRFTSSLFGGEFNSTSRNLSFTGNYAERRAKSTQESSGISSKTRYARTTISYNNPEKTLFCGGFYNLATLLQNKVEKYFVRVPSGTGEWQYDPIRNEYIETPNGDYTQRERIVALGQPSIELKTGINSSINPLRFFDVRILKRFTVSANFNVEHLCPLNSAPPFSFFLPLPPSNIIALTFGLFSSRVELLLPFSGRSKTNASWRLEYLDDRRISNPEIRRDESFSLDITKELSESFDGSVFTERRTLFRLTPQPYYAKLKTERYNLNPGINLYIQSSAEIGFYLSISTEKEHITYNIRCNRVALLLKGSTPFYSGVLRGYVEISSVLVKNKNLYLPSDMAYGEQPGYNFNWNMSFERKLGNSLSVLLIYDGKAGEREKTFHSFRMDGQFYF